eukprot:8342524-Pyramimonas_sp.AAC.2
MSFIWCSLNYISPCLPHPKEHPVISHWATAVNLLVLLMQSGSHLNLKHVASVVAKPCYFPIHDWSTQLYAQPLFFHRADVEFKSNPNCMFHRVDFGFKFNPKSLFAELSECTLSLNSTQTGFSKS